MKKTVSALLAILFAAFTGRADVSLEECLTAAYDNYPIIKQYDLLSISENIELEDIDKGWLPKIGVYAQATAQNVVPTFPTSLSRILQQMGGEMKGLGKLQYKAGLDLNQTVWDGGVSKSRREITRRKTDAERASLDVDMYGIRGRIESLYFAILLMQSQIEQTESAIGVYESNLERINSLVKNGAAMKADSDMVEAQLLTIRQQLASAQSAARGYRSSLSAFTGLDLYQQALALPEAVLPTVLTNNRPELNLFDSQQKLNESRRRSIDAMLMPKVGFFAQTYYGYPGIDYFKAMMERKPSFNLLAGLRVSWNIDSFYTKKNSLKKIDVADQQIESQRETFLLNSEILTASQRDEIHGIERVMADDARIVELRRNVRMAAESQLRNGVIDITALTTKINDEMQASLKAAYHNIQHLKAIYNLKNTLNQ